MIDRLPHSTQLMYSELLDELVHAALSSRGITFAARTIDGRAYWYLEYVIGPSKQAFYLGPDDDETRARVEAAQARWKADASSAETRARLVAMLRSGGAIALPSGHARVLEALSQAGVFVQRGVVIGSHAFALLGNALGVRWTASATRTKDVDLAHDPEVSITVPDLQVDLQESLRAANQDFLPVPALNRKHPSTTFTVRGEDLSVSLLTPMRGRPDSMPRRIAALNAMAAPMRFLDYILEDIQPAVVPVRSGVLVNVPSPARFALHKLVVSQRRPAAFATKARKDLRQADMILDVLFDDRPGDLMLALDAARAMPPKFLSQISKGASRLAEPNRERLHALVDGSN